MSEKGHVVEDLNRLDAARRYLDLGWCVLPTRPGEKYPCLRAWKEYQDRLPTEAELATWFERWPDSELGVVTGPVSDLVVTDVDVGEHYAPVTVRVGVLLEAAPTELVARTPSGGAHLFHHHPGHPVSNAVGDGIDVRGDGGFVKLPLVPPDEPTQHDPEGRAWTHHGEPGPWSAALEPDEGGTSIEEGPEASPVSELWKGVGKDRRNDSCARLAGSLARRGVPEEEAVEMLSAWNLRNDPPLGQHPEDEEPAEVEIRRTVASIYRKEGERRERESEEGATPEIRLTRHTDYTRKYAIGGGTRWLVRDWIPEQGFGTVVGPPATYKTWLLYDLAYSVATGSDFLGQFPVEEQGPVIVFQLEDSNPDTARRFNLIEWFRRGWMVPPEQDGDGVLTAPLPLHPPIYHNEEFNVDLEPGTIDQICECVLEVEAKLAIFDPFFTLGDLDDYLAGAAKKLQPLKNRRQELDCGFLFGHHSKKNAEDVDSTERRRTWGSQFLDASKNFDWQVRKLDDARVGLKRYFKNAATIPEVEVSFNINDRPDRGPWAYGVEVQEKSPFGSPLQGGTDEALSEDALRRALYEFICANEGCNASQIQGAFDLRGKRVIRARDWLEEEGFIENREKPSGEHAWYPTGEPLLGTSLAQKGS